MSVEEAIKVWTLDGAYATFEEKNKGSITPGKLADFAVLRKDPRKVSPDAIKDIIVDATYIGGTNVWQAPKNALAVIHHLVPGIDFGDGDEEENLIMWVSEYRLFAAGQTQGACPTYTSGFPGVCRGIFGCQGSVAA